MWLYFTATVSNIAKCNKCFKTITCKGGSTLNSLKHAAIHGILLKAEGCNLPSIADDTLQSALVLGSGSSVPDGDGRGEDGLNDGCVEVHHHRLWQVEFLQLL